MDTLLIEKGYKLTMPSAFTPNNDGLNDVFKPSHDNIIQTTIQIYNKYGALVYESSELEAEWDGNLKDVPLPQDSYLYVIEYVAESGVARTERDAYPYYVNVINENLCPLVSRFFFIEVLCSVEKNYFVVLNWRND